MSKTGMEVTSDTRGSFTDLMMPVTGRLMVRYPTSNRNQPTSLTELVLYNLDDVKAIQIQLEKLRRQMVAHQKFRFEQATKQKLKKAQA